MTVAKALIVSFAAIALTTACGKTASQDKRSGDDPKAKKSESGDSTAADGYAIEGTGMSFDLALPEEAEPEAEATTAEDAASEDDAADAIPAVSSPHIDIACKFGFIKFLRHKSQFSISLERLGAEGDKASVETATAWNCGRAVKVKVAGLEPGVKYKLSASLVIKDRVAFAGESEPFTLESKRVKLVLSRAKMPKWQDVDVDIVFKDKDHGGMDDGDDDVICPANFAPTACWAKIDRQVECIKAPCPTLAALPLFVLGSNQCRAMARLTKKAEVLGVKLAEGSIHCESRELGDGMMDGSGGDGGDSDPSVDKPSKKPADKPLIQVD